MIPDFKSLVKRIGANEGFERTPYQCTMGVWTIGHGFTWITEEESLHILAGRVSELHLELGNKWVWYDGLPPEIKGVVIEMCFQLGVFGFSKFKKAIAHMIDKEWQLAADEMLDSKWRKQTPNRANRLATIVRDHG